MNQEIETQPAQDYANNYPIYKPNSRGSGGVMRFQLNSGKGALFIDAAPQSGERQFDWERKITMKWGLSDIGAVLAVLQNRQSQSKLFHQTEKASSRFEITRQDDPQRAPYLLVLSRQTAADQSPRQVAVPLTHGEGAVLETILRDSVTRILAW